MVVQDELRIRQRALALRAVVARVPALRRTYTAVLSVPPFPRPIRLNFKCRLVGFLAGCGFRFLAIFALGSAS